MTGNVNVNVSDCTQENAIWSTTISTTMISWMNEATVRIIPRDGPVVDIICPIGIPKMLKWCESPVIDTWPKIAEPDAIGTTTAPTGAAAAVEGCSMPCRNRGFRGGTRAISRVPMSLSEWETSTKTSTHLILIDWSSSPIPSSYPLIFWLTHTPFSSFTIVIVIIINTHQSTSWTAWRPISTRNTLDLHEMLKGDSWLSNYCTDISIWIILWVKRYFHHYFFADLKFLLRIFWQYSIQFLAAKSQIWSVKATYILTIPYTFVVSAQNCKYAVTIKGDEHDNFEYHLIFFNLFNCSTEKPF